MKVGGDESSKTDVMFTGGLVGIILVLLPIINSVSPRK